VNKRQIKFRVWTGTSFDTSNNFAISSDGTLGKICDGDAQFCNCQNDDPFVIQQFTGILDRNGKEIYEGDVVIYSGITGVIKFERGAFDVFDFDGLPVGYAEESAICNCKIVGNIFEK
jgi:uncharacterized phage protein (TIGR01671 family)